MAKTIDYPSYEEAKKIVMENGIKSAKEYMEHYKELGLPSTPHVYYKDKGWENWTVFFGKECVSFPSYEEAKKIVMENGITRMEDYWGHYKRLGLPSNPHVYYKNKGWENWTVFFGKECVSFPSYEEAKKIVLENGIKSAKEYMEHNKGLGLPSNPDAYYKDKGWENWFVFLGKIKTPTFREREKKVFKTLCLNPSLLKDDAPLQIVYILASQMDKKLAHEIESLLSTTSYEERLNWVKEQLKDLKEDSSKDTESETTADDLSPLESMMETFEDTIEDLPDEMSSDIKSILDNYYHNAVNRELIGEYDD